MSLLWPAYLAGLVALGLPWLLHRFSRTDPPERPFPSKQFLEPAEPPVSRERQLRYRGLFLLRVLLLIGLCLLFAEPWLRTGTAADGAEQRHLIVVDTSLSQRLGERWERTRTAARAAIDAVPVGHTLQLLAADTALTSLTEASTDPSAALAALSNLEPGHAKIDYGELMQRLDIVAARDPLPVVATVITDAQRRSLPQRLGSLTARDITKLTLVDVAEAGERNDYLTAAARTSDEVYARVSVTAGTSGDTADPEGGTRTRQVVVSYQGQVLATENVALVQGESRTLLFERLAMPAAEVVKLNIAFEDRDALPDDDSVNVVVRAATPVDVGIRAIDVPLPRQAPVFIATALETDDVARIIEAPASQGLSDELKHAIVFADLDDDARIPPAVEQFVQDGGNVLLVDVSAMRQPVVFDQAVGIGLIDEAHPLKIGTLDWYEASWYGAPPWAARGQASEAALQGTDETSTVTSSLPADGDYRVLLQTTAGSPVLIERRRAATEGSAAGATRPSAAATMDDDLRLDEAGNLLIIADPLDGEISDFPLQPAFVGFMQQLVDYFETSSAVPDRVMAGSRLDLPANLQVLDDDGERLLDLGGAVRGQSLQLDRPGLYNVINQQGSHWLEVVIDAEESDITTLPAAELQAWEARHAADARPADDGAGSGAPEAEASLLRSDGALALWRWLLPIALALVIGESLLANRRLDVRRDGS